MTAFSEAFRILCREFVLARIILRASFYKHRDVVCFRSLSPRNLRNIAHGAAFRC